MSIREFFIRLSITVNTLTTPLAYLTSEVFYGIKYGKKGFIFAHKAFIIGFKMRPAYYQAVLDEDLDKIMDLNFKAIDKGQALFQEVINE